MLKTKAFKFSDDAGINELLSKHILYKGADLMVSNGEIIIPYEDGQLPNTEQKILKLLELRNSEIAKTHGILHDQKVLGIQEKGIKKEIQDAESKMVTLSNKKEDYQNNKQFKELIQRLENVLTQTQNTIIMNQSELTRIFTDISVYDEEIAVLEGKEIKE
jgi:hypothetical protein